MESIPGSTRGVRASRWTPFRLLIVGAGLGLFSLLLGASLATASTLAFLSGELDPVPVWLFLVNVAVVGILGPVGLFLVLCGIAFSILSLRPRPRSRTLRIALGGAGLNLAAGLLLGILNLSLYLLPLQFGSREFLKTVIVVSFLATVVSGAGLLLAFSGIALAARDTSTHRPSPARPFGQPRRGKSIYRGDPSGR